MIRSRCPKCCCEPSPSKPDVYQKAKATPTRPAHQASSRRFNHTPGKRFSPAEVSPTTALTPPHFQSKCRFPTSTWQLPELSRVAGELLHKKRAPRCTSLPQTAKVFNDDVQLASLNDVGSGVGQARRFVSAYFSMPTFIVILRLEALSFIYFVEGRRQRWSISKSTKWISRNRIVAVRMV